MIYLDYNATSPLSPAARSAWLKAYDDSWGNPSSIHGAGQQARQAIDQAKAVIAKNFGVKASDLVITSGGTEANATVIAAVAAPSREIAATAIEHSSVLRNAERVAKQSGCTLRILPVDACGRLSPETIAEGVGPLTRLVCFQFANNEIGIRQDVPALAAAVRRANPSALILLDCAQGAGKVPIDFSELAIDCASVAGHKFGAPKGVGVLYVRRGVTLPALLSGGRQQQDRRSGTEDAALVCAMSAALSERLANWRHEADRQSAALTACWRRIKTALPDSCWIAQEGERMPHVLSIGHAGVANEALVTRLDLRGFAVSKGSACIAQRGEPSHVISALGLDPDLARSVIRVSIGPGISEADLIGFADAYVAEVSAMMAVR